MNTLMVVLTVVAVLMQGADWYTTVSNLNRGALEANPVVRWVIGKLGVEKGVAVAKGVATIASTILGYASYQQPNPAGFILVAVIVVYGIVLWKNWKLYKVLTA